MVEQFIESSPTEPFIVMTNESQFGESAMKLLKKAAFVKEEKTSWPCFANYLQIHFLSATRQTFSEIKRPITMFDFEYIRSNYFKEKDVEAESFKEFWKWFGKVLHKIRHQKPVPEMWNTGLIFGFISKEQASLILSKHSVGDFLIRFSEKSPGQFALAYLTNNGVKHFLVPNSVKKLPDFLNERMTLKSILVCNTNFHSSTLEDIVKTTLPKSEAISSYCTNVNSTNVTGYETELI